MKIDTIQNYPKIKYNYYKLDRVWQKYSFASDVFENSSKVGFRGITDVNSPVNELCYDKFIARFHEVYGNRTLNEVVNNVIQNNEELNHGWEKKVFHFPKMEEYLIAHFYTKTPHKSELPIVKYDIKYPKYNFAQFIAGNNYDIGIMKYISGFPNSVDHYYSIIPYICQNNCATKEMANEYLSKLRLLEKFPQKSYDDLAEKFKYLSDNGAFADSINCNNLLVDTEQQKFHLIDLPPVNGAERKVSERLGGAKQSAYDMISLLLDPRFQCYYLDQMHTEEKQETKNISQNAIEKCFNSAKKVSLSTKKDFIKEYYKFIQDINPNWTENFSRRYAEFLKLYKL